MTILLLCSFRYSTFTTDWCRVWMLSEGESTTAKKDADTFCQCQCTPTPQLPQSLCGNVITERSLSCLFTLIRLSPMRLAVLTLKTHRNQQPWIFLKQWEPIFSGRLKIMYSIKSQSCTHSNTHMHKNRQKKNKGEGMGGVYPSGIICDSWGEGYFYYLCTNTSVTCWY